MKFYLTTPVDNVQNVMIFDAPKSRRTNKVIANQIKTKAFLEEETISRKFFNAITHRQTKWLPLNVAWLQSVREKDSPENIATTQEIVVVKLLKLVEATGIKKSEIKKAIQEKNVEGLLNSHLERAQRIANRGFSNKELYLCGLTGAIYREVMAAIDNPSQMLSEAGEQVIPNAKQKVYYNFSTKVWSANKKDEEKAHRITVQYEDGSAFQIKSAFIGAKGITKEVYFRPQLKTQELLVKCKEKIVPLKKELNKSALRIEKEIFQQLHDIPQIVTCYEIKEKKIASEKNVKQRNYLMEYCSGTLYSEYPNLTDLEKILVIRDLLLGLSALHQNGYIHFDVHTNNCLISKKEGIPSGKLTDFGNSRRISDVNNSQYFLSEMIFNGFWGPNFGAYTPEIMAYWIKSHQEHASGVKLSEDTLNQFGVNTFFHKPISGKNDIFHLGVTLAIEHYQLTLDNIGLKKLPSFLFFLHTVPLHKTKIKSLSIDDLLTLFQAYNQNYQAPEATHLIEFLIWWMVRPDPDDRPTAYEAAEFLNAHINNPPPQHKKKRRRF